MVIVKLNGGLGNQFFQYALGRAISIKRNTQLKLDLSSFEEYRLRQYSLDHFNIVENIASADDLARFHQYPSSPVGMLATKIGAALAPAHFRFSTIVEDGFRFDPRVLQAEGNLYLDGYWQSEKYFSSISDVLRKELTLKDEPDAINKELAQVIAESDSVSLHIRRGDYASDPETNRIHGTCSLEFYRMAANELMKTATAPHFFVFSDEPEWARENLEIDGLVTFVSHNAVAKDYEDLRLMSSCKHHIIANSSFSWWGAWLGNYPEKIVFAPKTWFQTELHDVKDLIPKTWRVI